MKGRRASFGVAIGVSLAAHGLMVPVSRWYVVSAPGDGAAPTPRYAEMRVVDAAPDPSAPETQPATADQAPEGKVEPDEFELGKIDGIGYASHEAEGKRQQLAREAEVDQATLSLDPIGPGDADAAAAPEVAPEGDNGLGPEAAGGGGREGAPLAAALLPAAASDAPELSPVSAVPTFRANPPPAERDEGRELDEPAGDSAAMLLPSGRVEAQAPPPASEPPAPSRPAVVASAPVSASAAAAAVTPLTLTPGDGRRPGQDRPAADPAPMSDSESDPFSTLGSAEFRTGGLDVRFGRKVKTRRPKIMLAGKVELWQRQGAKVVLRISVDEAGKVTNVDVVKSSGSNEVDQPCRVAVYDWWFEPKKNAAGQPVPDEFQFTITWH